MWQKIKFISLYILTSPITVVKSFLRDNQDKESSRSNSWRQFFTFYRNPETYLEF